MKHFFFAIATYSCQIRFQSLVFRPHATNIKMPTKSAVLLPLTISLSCITLLAELLMSQKLNLTKIAPFYLQSFFNIHVDENCAVFIQSPKQISFINKKVCGRWYLELFEKQLKYFAVIYICI